MRVQTSRDLEFEQRRVQALRRMGSSGRLKAGFGLFDFARAHLTANFRVQHPEWTDQQVREAVRLRLMGRR